MKYVDAPEKFLDSEVDLDEQIKSLLQVSCEGYQKAPAAENGVSRARSSGFHWEGPSTYITPCGGREVLSFLLIIII